MIPTALPACLHFVSLGPALKLVSLVDFREMFKEMVSPRSPGWRHNLSQKPWKYLVPMLQRSKIGSKYFLPGLSENSCTDNEISFNERKQSDMGHSIMRLPSFFLPPSVPSSFPPSFPFCIWIICLRALPRTMLMFLNFQLLTLS